ncbi:glycosyltransferase [Methylobacterium nodulans]|uniref:Glycosyl transferase group 1 n=1 Tax=Methylobacterium nodulans (strain LMG 21967 / CNCM I-2342 / ORS 2060) TaxID=460265 RepID=B8IAH2_METNO|nr:glycosyltransferase [Methylobacterium nodulans]ACL59235.1 glycosyl transferase group 1 [Methylobacterium nodulans ORS 2060]
MTPRILIVHNRYQIRGGEDAVVECEAAALARAGCAVDTVFVSNDDIRGPVDRLRAAIEAPRAPRGITRVLEAVRRFRPDIVHAHNTFPLISPAVHAAVRAAGPATVQTLHNFRVACAGAMLLRDGTPCETCLTGSPYAAVRHGCYRGSRVGSLAVARMIDWHRRAGTWSHSVDAFVALTEFARRRFIAAGLPADRIAVKPNGLADPGPPTDAPREGLLFAGRLSREKGLETLAAAAARMRAPVEVAGDGPLRADLAGAAGLRLLGNLTPAEVQHRMARAAALVVPSLWYEGLPMVVVEAYAAGTPVIASRIGALADLVEDGITGFLVTPGDPDDLARALDRVLADPAAARRMGAAARTAYARSWTEEATTASLLSIYRRALASRSLAGLQSAS